MLKLRFGPAIRSRRNHAHLVCSTEFGQRLTRDPERLSRLSGFVLKVDG